MTFREADILTISNILGNTQNSTLETESFGKGTE